MFDLCWVNMDEDIDLAMDLRSFPGLLSNGFENEDLICSEVALEWNFFGIKKSVIFEIFLERDYEILFPLAGWNV